MSKAHDSSSTTDQCERLFAAFLERYHETETDPEELFLAHPEHATTLRRWWQRLAATGEVRATHRTGDGFGPFALLRQLGSGAQGTVHLAEDTRLGRQTALKILPLHRAVRADAIQRFRREAEVASRLDHPSICRVYEAGEHQGVAYIAMQHIEGVTLADHLTEARNEGRPMAIDLCLALAEQVARALHQAHEAGLVHRDIKPGNIMVTPERLPVVLDFGLARDAHESSDLTRTGDLLGTPAYMSPEQLHGGRFTVDARTDVYSLAVTLYECLTLRRPFEAPTQEQLLQHVLTAAVPDPRQWRPELDDDTVLVLMTALAKDREHRYASAAAFAEDLRRLRAREGVLAKPIGPLQRAWSWSRRWPALAASIALFITSLIAGTIVSLLLYLDAQAQHAAFVQLADLERLREAESAAAMLHPARPELAAELLVWLEQHGRPLAERLPRHRAALADLRQYALPRMPSDDERDLRQHPDQARIRELRERSDEIATSLENARTRQAHTIMKARVARFAARAEQLEQTLQDYRRFTFSDSETAFLHNQLEQLVDALTRFESPTGTLPAMEDRWRWARSMQQLTVTDRGADWQRVAAAIAADARYRHRALPPQPGLVPLGPDPRSQLQEFAFARGGTIPVRDPDSGQLRLDGDSAPVLVLIPPQAFVVGASSAPASLQHDRDAKPIEGPPVRRRLTWYFIGKHELTRGQWRRLGGSEETMLPAEDLVGDADLHPMTDLSWQLATEVLSWHELLLPTELQWECATRAGSTTRFWTGQDAASLAGAANYRDDGEDGYVLTAPVDSLRPNAFGLHHTAGNVAEWCRDQTRGPYRPKHSEADDVEAGDGLLPVLEIKRRSLRGGSFTRVRLGCRTAARGFRNPDSHYVEVGVRLARPVHP